MRRRKTPIEVEGDHTYSDDEPDDAINDVEMDVQLAEDDLFPILKDPIPETEPEVNPVDAVEDVVQPEKA